MAREVANGLRSNIRAIITFFIGICLGSSIFLCIYGIKIDSLYKELDETYYSNNQKYKEILQLQRELAGVHQSNREDKIKKIVVEVISNDRISISGAAVKLKVEELMAPFLGKSMQWVCNNPDLVEIVLQNKTILIDAQTKVHINVRYLSFFKSTLRVWVTAAEISDDGVSNSTN